MKKILVALPVMGTTSASVYRKKVIEARTLLLYAIATGSYTVAPISSFQN